MKLLVTGGAGFIGSNFIRYWLDAHADDDIVNLDALTYAADPNSLADVAVRHPHRYRIVRGDIADGMLVNELVAGVHPDVIVNFAAESHNSRGVLDPMVFVRTNVVGTQVLLEAARHHATPRFHHVSTCEVYGDLPLDSADSFTESSPYRPRTPYSASKAAADLLVRAYHNTYGIAATISNSANTYGPWQFPEKVIPLFATNAIAGRPLPLYRQSANRREWIHVLDHCRAIDLILRRGTIGETYNVGTGDERSIEEIADAILGLLERPAALKTYVDDRPGHDRRYLLDHTKIERELGWRPRIPLDDGLRETIDWYAENQDWWLPKVQVSVDEFVWATSR